MTMLVLLSFYKFTQNNTLEHNRTHRVRIAQKQNLRVSLNESPKVTQPGCGPG